MKGTIKELKEALLPPLPAGAAASPVAPTVPVVIKFNDPMERRPELVIKSKPREISHSVEKGRSAGTSSDPVVNEKKEVEPVKELTPQSLPVSSANSVDDTPAPSPAPATSSNPSTNPNSKARPTRRSAQGDAPLMMLPMPSRAERQQERLQEKMLLNELALQGTSVELPKRRGKLTRFAQKGHELRCSVCGFETKSFVLMDKHKLLHSTPGDANAPSAGSNAAEDIQDDMDEDDENDDEGDENDEDGDPDSHSVAKDVDEMVVDETPKEAESTAPLRSSDVPKTFQCPSCDEKFELKSQLTIHVRERHSQNPQIPSNESVGSEELEDEDAEVKAGAPSKPGSRCEVFSFLRESIPPSFLRFDVFRSAAKRSTIRPCWTST